MSSGGKSRLGVVYDMNAKASRLFMYDGPGGRAAYGFMVHSPYDEPQRRHKQFTLLVVPATQQDAFPFILEEHAVVDGATTLSRMSSDVSHMKRQAVAVSATLSETYGMTQSDAPSRLVNRLVKALTRNVAQELGLVDATPDNGSARPQRGSGRRGSAASNAASSAPRVSTRASTKRSRRAQDTTGAKVNVMWATKAGGAPKRVTKAARKSSAPSPSAVYNIDYDRVQQEHFAERQKWTQLHQDRATAALLQPSVEAAPAATATAAESAPASMPYYNPALRSAIMATAIWNSFDKRAAASASSSDADIRAAMRAASAQYEWYAAHNPTLFKLGAARADWKYPTRTTTFANAEDAFPGIAELVPRLPTELQWQYYVRCIDKLEAVGALTTAQAAQDIRCLASMNRFMM